MCKHAFTIIASSNWDFAFATTCATSLTEGDQRQPLALLITSMIAAGAGLRLHYTWKWTASLSVS